MKSLILPLLFVLFHAFSEAAVLESEGPSIKDMDRLQEMETKKLVLHKLKEAKIFLINGNVIKARRILKQIPMTGLVAQKNMHRLMGIIEFIEGNYEESLRHLSSKALSSDNDYKKYCVTKILNLMILGKIRSLKQESEKCQVLNYEASDSDHLWLKSLVMMKLRDPELFKKNYIRDFFNLTYEVSLPVLRVLLKLAIYLNQEASLHDLGQILPPKFYDFSEIRELMGINFYRMGKTAEAFEFIEDLQTPNIENLKGNLRLEKKEFELAFGHFQMALQKKPNSANAIERSIPLAYLLKQWDKGIDLVKKIRVRKENIKQKLSLLSAFQIHAGQFSEAQKSLQELLKYFQGHIPHEVLLLYSYNSLRLGESENLRKFSDASCRHYDALNCWLLLQTFLWEDFSKTIRRKDKVYDDPEITFDSLKERPELDPLVEPIFIHQRDIEEMDERAFEFKY